jgi:predicted nucleic acid-binding protein
MSRIVLDSYAILALLNDEPGASEVREVLSESQAGEGQVFLCAANLGEVFYIVRRRKGDEAANQVVAFLRSLSVRIVTLDERLALLAGALKSEHAMSFADCMAAATAIDHEAAVMTADPEFRSVEGMVEVRWLPR